MGLRNDYRPIDIKYLAWLYEHFPKSPMFPTETDLDAMDEAALMRAIEGAKIGVLAECLGVEHSRKFHFALGLCLCTKWRRFHGPKNKREQTNQPD